MMQKTFWNISWRYLLHHPWQSILMIIGITLGVAVVIAVDLANASASRAFDLSTETIAGKATHFITGGPQGLDDAVYSHMRRAGLEIPMAPIVTEYISSPELGGRPIQLLGVDPFAEAPFRNYLGASSPNTPSSLPTSPSPSGNMSIFFTQPGAVFISTSLAERYSLTPGDTISLEVAGHTKNAVISGLLQPDNELSRRALDDLLLADIATAQELTGRTGSLDRIDLILPDSFPEGSSAILNEQLQELLPIQANLQSSAATGGAVEQMTAAFRVNLSALSLLALLVGLFLIYNTITFSVVQRRPLFGTLRCLGVTRREIFLLVTSEALIIGIIGAMLGIALGITLGQGTVRLVTQTINDLFFVVTVRGVQIPVNSLIKGSLLGLVATLITAAPPAWEAASVPPRAALMRSGLEKKARNAARLAAVFGLSMIILGVLILAFPSHSLVISFMGTFIVVVGFALLVPLTTRLLMQVLTPIMGRLWGTLGRMAPRDVANSLSRTAIAVMALMIAVSVTVGVSLMVSSFRTTVVTWLEETLHSDIYISAPSLSATTPSIPILPGIIEKLNQWPGIARVDKLRSIDVASPDGPVNITAIDNPNIGTERIYLATDVPPTQIWARLQQGAVIVSEPFAYRLDLPDHGGTITLSTPTGQQQFPIVGIYHDYASTQGTVLMSLSVYQQFWLDPDITALGLRLSPEADTSQITHELQDSLASLQRLTIRPNQILRDEVLVIFDRTFAITSALQILATIVAFVGVLSALLSLELERQRELGILRSVGLTARQLWKLIMLETGLMGAAAGILAMPTGYALALILIYIINRRSFGWTLQMQIPPTPFLQALLVSVVAALIAGSYPAWRMGRMVISDALRSE